jgi:hypothetical protein
MKQLNLPGYSFKIKSKEQKKYIFDEIRKKFVLLTPEEWVRQNFIRYLVQEKHFSSQLMAVEMTLEYNRLSYRADAVAYNRQMQPVLIVECKAPDVKLKQDHFDQIARYNMQLRVEYLIVTNGIHHYCCRIDFDNGKYAFLKDIPEFEDLR